MTLILELSAQQLSSVLALGVALVHWRVELIRVVCRGYFYYCDAMVPPWWWSISIVFIGEVLSTTLNWWWLVTFGRVRRAMGKCPHWCQCTLPDNFLINIATCFNLWEMTILTWKNGKRYCNGECVQVRKTPSPEDIDPMVIGDLQVWKLNKHTMRFWRRLI